MNKKTNIEFAIVLVVAIIVIYVMFSFIEFKIIPRDWTVASRIASVLSLLTISGFTAKNLYK